MELDIKIDDLRPAMIWLYKKKNMSQEMIAELFDVNRQTVGRALKRYSEQGNCKDRPRSGRPVTATTEARQEVPGSSKGER